MVALDMSRPVAAEAESRPAIRIEGVCKWFGDLKVLDTVDAEIADCEFVSILGPSGCGKSTLLRLMAGLVPYEEGNITLLDTPVESPSADVGFVFQTSNLLPWANVRKNLLLAAELDRKATQPDEAAIAAMVETLGLTGFEDSYPHELSGGMRHRVAIGQALIRSPRVLLMDEPFGALDALTRDHLNVELLKIWQKEKKTVVLVTHSIAESILLSDRVLVMSERPGRVIRDIRIDLPRPRHPSETRKDPMFGEYAAELGRLMGVA
ncbi:ABC transporter ATP-binding protein [Gimibacter soli]|uniref:ABC transporter ATP-binding protein n=1 Tax=Gimibacter soli TaxID=3024400 RepID=A0AAF0BLE2_9PROT|nr:ABC transporter ATP-binding protein [Gimibacter soli]WCL53325.1 ABC transporter ATP-binding protein [Gimibacter soli]